MSTTRRQWLKTGATGAAGLAAGSLLPGALKDAMAAEAAEGATGAEAAAKAAARARIADSRPEPGPLTVTSTVLRPCSCADLAAASTGLIFCIFSGD